MKNFLFLLLFVLPEISFAQTDINPKIFKTAVEYNDYIISEQTAIGNQINELMALVNDTSSTFDQAKKKLGVLAARSKEAEENARKLPSYNGNTSFRDAAASLFLFYYTTFSSDYATIIDLMYNGGGSNEAYERIDSIIANISVREKNYDELFSSEQKKFADDNNFTISENK